MEIKLSNQPQKVVCLNVSTNSLKTESSIASNDLTKDTVQQMIKEEFGDEYALSKDATIQVRIEEDKIQIVAVIVPTPSSNKKQVRPISIGKSQSKNSY